MDMRAKAMAVMSLALPTYVADISHDIFYVGETFFVGTNILCQNFMSESATFLLHFR